MANAPIVGKWNTDAPGPKKLTAHHGYAHTYDDLAAGGQPEKPPGVVAGQATDDDREAQRRLAQPLLENLK